MSASPRLKVPFVSSPRPLRELELMRTVGNIAWNSSREDQAFESVDAALTRVHGLIGFRFEPSDQLLHLPAYETVKPGGVASTSFARAAVAANGKVWGEILLFFDPKTSAAVESPLRVARFIGQQLGLMLNRLVIHRDRRELLARLDQLRTVVRRRKSIHRAAAILAKRRNISGTEAISFMAGHAKRNRRGLLEISESLILGTNPAMITRLLFWRGAL